MKLNGETVYVGTTAVDNVLVHVGEFERGHLAVSEISKPVGTNVDYTLYFPMTYEGDLTGKNVTVRGYDCKVLGHPDHERPEQVFGRKWFGKWDMTVHVERTLVDFSETIQVLKTVVTRDTLGNRSTATSELYNGAAQARKQSASESEDEGTVSTETWFFVMPWLNEFATTQTQQLSIVYDERTYDVVEIIDHDWEHNYASIKAVWHG